MKKSEAGFTMVEAIVTMLVSSLLLIAAIQAQSQVSTLAIQQVQYSTASNLAYNNMRKYVNDQSPIWFECKNGSPGVTQHVLIDSSGDYDGLPGTVTQKVVATAPYGCGGGSDGIGMPIRVESTVTYRNGGQSVSHAAYAAF